MLGTVVGREHGWVLRLSMNRASVEDGAEVWEHFREFTDDAEAAGFRPLVRAALDRQAETLQIAELATRRRPAPDAFGEPDRTVVGEIFRRGDVLVIASVSSDEAGYLVENLDGTLRRRRSPEHSLQIAAVSEGPDGGCLEELSDLASKRFGVTLEPFSYTSRRFDELREEGRDRPSVPDEAEVEAATLLSEPKIRSLAIAVKASAGLLVSDVPKQLAQADRSRANELQEQLETAGLVERDVVVICRKTQAQTNRVPSVEVLQDLASKGVRCACGRLLVEERHEEAIAVTDLGRSLLDGSRWFSILLVEELHALGVPPDRILVEQESGGDEMDCIADISGEIAFFELKDKEFSLGNAYSFGAKMGIVRPQHPVIVTTEHVGNDAKEHFSRARSAADEGRRYRGYGSGPGDEPRPVQYVEGISNLRSGLERIVSDIYRRDAVAIARGVVSLVVADPGAVINSVLATGGARSSADATNVAEP